MSSEIIALIFMLLSLGLCGYLLFLSMRDFRKVRKKKATSEKKKPDKSIAWNPFKNNYELLASLLRLPGVKNQINQIVQEAYKHFEVDGGKLYLLSNPKEIQLVSIFGIEGVDIETGHSLKIGKGEDGEGMAGMVMDTQKPLIVQNYSSWPGHIKKLGHLFMTVMEVPVIRQDKTIGVLSVFTRKIRKSFTEIDVEALLKYANQISGVIANAELDIRSSNIRNDTKTLRDLYKYITDSKDGYDVNARILRALDQLIPYSRATLQGVRGEGRELLAFNKLERENIAYELLNPIPESEIISKIVQEKIPVIIPDTSREGLWDKDRFPTTRDVESWIGIPLVYEDKVIALITVDSVKKNFFKDVRRDLLTLFSQHAAIALKTQGNSQRQQLINEIVSKINSKNKAEEIFDELVSQVAKALNCPRCKLFMPKYTNEGNVLLRPVKIYNNLPGNSENRSFRSDEGMAGSVFNKGETMLLEDAPKHKNFSMPKNKNNLIHSMLITPIKVNDITIGVLSCDHPLKGWFNENDKDFLENIISSIGFSIERSNCLEQLLSIGDKIFNSPSIDNALAIVAKGSVEVTRGHTSSVYLHSNNGNRRLISYPNDLKVPRPRKGNGLTKKAFNQNKEIVITDTRKNNFINPGLVDIGVISMVCVPIVFRDIPLGAIYVHLYGDDPYTFSQHEITSLKILANQAIQVIVTMRNNSLNSNSLTVRKEKLAELYDSLKESGFDYMFQ